MSDKDKTTTFIIDAELHTKFKVKLAENGQPMAKVLRQLIEQYIKSDGKIK